MFYNYLHSPSVSRSMQSSFAGLNKNARIGDSEFADMKNMSSDHLPLLAPRKMRSVVQKALTKTIEEVIVTEETSADGTVTETETTIAKEVKYNLNGILGDVGFAAVWGSDFYYMGKKVDGISLIDGEKKMLAMGSYILIYPDTVYYNTEIGEYGIMETGESESGTCEFILDSGITLDDGTVSGEDIAVKYIYKSNNSNKPSIYKLPLYPMFNKISTKSNTTDYRPLYDGEYIPVRLNNGVLEYLYSAEMLYVGGSGYDISVKFENEVWKTLPIKTITVTNDFGIENTLNLWYGNNFVKINGSLVSLAVPGEFSSIFNTAVYSKDALGVSYEFKAAYTWTHKNLPSFDSICVHENRLWGCRYGMQATGETVNEIYCSKLGDFKTWTLSSDTATLAGDPYTMSVGEYGPFTGCISHRGYVLFFKDDVIYRVSGTKPANFQITKIATCGVQQGCERSMEIIDEVLYYKSKSGIYAYDGSLPQKISSALGEGYYTDAVAGSLLSKYYIAMKQGGERKLYVYDTRYGVWHAEDDIDARFFTEYDGALYGGVGNDIVCLAGTPADIFTETESEGDFEWAAESGDIGLSSPYQKYYRRLALRMDMETGARVKVSLLCGNEWLIAADFTAPDKRSFIMPVVTPRCDHMRIRIEGVGEAKIYSISFETETVGDRPMR